MRYFRIGLFKKAHIVREMAYQGKDGRLARGLCGVWPDIGEGGFLKIVTGSEHKEIENCCRTCVKIAQKDGLI